MVMGSGRLSVCLEYGLSESFKFLKNSYQTLLLIGPKITGQSTENMEKNCLTTIGVSLRGTESRTGQDSEPILLDRK